MCVVCGLEKWVPYTQHTQNSTTFRPSIEQVFQNKSEEQVAAIQTTYKNKLDSSIKEEYDKQTEQLSRILQGKMDELQLRQQAINTGLESNFKEALTEFNREHSQVIEEVERKKQCAPIDLTKWRKVKEA